MENNKSGGAGISTLLLVLFIGLKLGGVIAWSWVWVLAPFWLPAFIILGFLAILGIVGLTVATIAR